MSDEPVPVDAFGRGCHRDACDHPTPWDMDAVVLNKKYVYCSPECASVTLDTTIDVDTLTAHDPQYHYRRPPGVHEETVDVIRNVRRDESVREALDDVAALMNSPNA